jgi:hypothetical protein
MWSGPVRTSRTVACIACGETLHREEAREYDKRGDRWHRDGKRFEYLCKACFRTLSKEPRDGVEATLVDIDAGEIDRETFFEEFAAAVEDGDHEHEA